MANADIGFLFLLIFIVGLQIALLPYLKYLGWSNNMCIPLYCGCVGYAIGCIFGYRLSESYSIHNEVYDPSINDKAQDTSNNNNNTLISNNKKLINDNNDDAKNEDDDDFFIVKKNEYII